MLFIVSENMYGEFAALATAFFWTVTALAFEVASKKVGSLAVNLFRLIFALIFLSIFCYFYRGFALPTDASWHAWKWLALSGIVGFVFGDYLLFRAYAIISARIAMLIMTLVPPITALTGWLLLGEVMNLREVVGMIMTMGGIAIAIVNKPGNQGKLSLNYPLKGILFAIGGAIGQAVGLVLSKYGMRSYDPFSSTQIRILAALLGFIIIILLLKKQFLIKRAIKSRKGMVGITIGSFFGPFLGVSFSLIAISYIATGTASTIMAIVPILLIPPAAFLFKQKIYWKEVIGALISVTGVALLFL